MSINYQNHFKPRSLARLNMAKMNLDANKALIISIIVLLAATSSMVFYYNNKIDEQSRQFNEKLSSAGNEINKNIKELKNSLEEKITGINNNLSTEIGLVDTNLRDYKTENHQQFNALNSLIDEIEKQSAIKLGEIKSELKSIKVNSKDFTAIIDDVVKSVVSVGTNTAQGSGVIIRDDSFIVTNYHVVDGASAIRVMTSDNKVYDALLIGYEPVIDVAVLKVDAKLKSLQFGNSDEVKVGEKVIALGNPAGLSFTVTEGIISAVHRKGSNGLDIYLQTDVPINPGNSGGPLVSADSKILGLNNFKISNFESLGFAIESNSVKKVADVIIEQYLNRTSG